MTVEGIALVVLTIWSGAVTFGLLAAYRQIALITVRLDQAGTVGDTGLPMGTPVPDAVLQELPQLLAGRSYLLFVSATCGPCLELLPKLEGSRFADRGVPAFCLLAGPEGLTDSVAADVPTWMTLVRDPAATLVGQTMRIGATPFSLRIESGMIAGKAWLRSPDDFERFLNSEPDDRVEGGYIARR